MTRAPVDSHALAARYIRPSGSPKVRFLLLVGALSLFGPLCIDMYLPALPKISENLHASASAIQLSLTMCLIGLAAGQIIYGVISDSLGRRGPLIAGLTLFVLASLCCSTAHSAALLAAFRFFQGLGGAAGIVVSRAIVRDLFEGYQAARVFSLLMLVTGCGPVLAPQIGAELLLLTSWRGVFLMLAACGTILLALAATRVPETLHGDLRTDLGFRPAFKAMRRVGTSIVFLQHAIATSLGFGAVFAYVAGASFAIENIYHASAQEFGLLFALNACGMIGASQVSARVVRRVGAQRLMTGGLIGMASSTVALLVVVVTHFGGLAAIVICMFATVSSNGFVGPNAMALSLQGFPEVAGSASALLGLAQFGLGAAVAPIVGIRGSRDIFPMALLMAGMGISALSARLILARRAKHVAAEHARTPHGPLTLAPSLAGEVEAARIPLVGETG
jgi:DHA1 family bicyclomycin/chloramphenicol resistance-like MFS transporter